MGVIQAFNTITGRPSNARVRAGGEVGEIQGGCEVLGASVDSQYWVGAQHAVPLLIFLILFAI